ncbi:MAG TPA: hypothetical protein VFJ91_00765 [Gaiellaceae bacterium]|nr:hypothetical protein [Gaiellaceae bacterium]
MRLADTLAAELAQQAWVGHDAPGEVTATGIRAALDRTFPGVSLEDVAEYATPAAFAVADADSLSVLRARFVGAIAAAMILGAKLQETRGT